MRSCPFARAGSTLKLVIFPKVSKMFKVCCSWEKHAVYCSIKAYCSCEHSIGYWSESHDVFFPVSWTWLTLRFYSEIENSFYGSRNKSNYFLNDDFIHSFLQCILSCWLNLADIVAFAAGFADIEDVWQPVSSAAWDASSPADSAAEMPSKYPFFRSFAVSTVTVFLRISE